MTTIALIQASAIIMAVVASPVAPWWAAPLYVQTFAHIVETLGSALIVAVVSAGVQIHYGVDARKDRKVKRLESHVEHGKGIEEAKMREVVLAAKVENAALHMADKVEAPRLRWLGPSQRTRPSRTRPRMARSGPTTKPTG